MSRTSQARMEELMLSVAVHARQMWKGSTGPDGLAAWQPIKRVCAAWDLENPGSLSWIPHKIDENHLARLKAAESPPEPSEAAHFAAQILRLPRDHPKCSLRRALQFAFNAGQLLGYADMHGRVPNAIANDARIMFVVGGGRAVQTAPRVAESAIETAAGALAAALATG